ncbi:hypothetical protein QQA45_00670 [Sneathia sanguinegens]|uniref:Tetratricopeptide repeat protein n=1 Tax=Sneathia sanguinegens TaxID=40543 RepID=A0ABT7HIP6_9FUSO|nr:hypothetical protein [Sneathia sanguinegens]MDK9580044.1 hypothetical protein [Sneathia sanguinegens]
MKKICMIILLLTSLITFSNIDIYDTNNQAYNQVMKVFTSKKTNKEKIESLKYLEKAGNNSFFLEGGLLALYKAENKNDKVNEIMNKINKLNNEELKDNFNLLVAKYLMLDLDRKEDSVEMLNNLILSKFNYIRSKAYILYYEYCEYNSDLENMLLCLKEAGKDKDNYLMVSNKYTQVYEFEKDLYQFLKENCLNATDEETMKIILTFSILNKDKIVTDKIIRRLNKKKIDFKSELNAAKKILNVDQVLDESEKYAKLALLNNEKNAYVALALITYYKGNIDEAIQYLKDAKKIMLVVQMI